MAQMAIGMIETRGLVGMIEAADATEPTHMTRAAATSQTATRMLLFISASQVFSS